MRSAAAIRRYTPADEPALLALLRSEGDEWTDYHSEEKRTQYRNVLQDSIVYVLHEGDFLCGYARLRDDGGYGVYVCDLLVHKDCRGKNYGRLLLERACADHPGAPVYVMSDADGYYEKLGCAKIGSIFSVTFRDGTQLTE